MNLKPRTYRNTATSERIDVRKVSKPVVGRFENDPTAPYGVRFVESNNQTPQ